MTASARSGAGAAVVLALLALTLGATPGSTSAHRADLPVVDAATGPDAGWTSYHGGENRTGYSPAFGPSASTAAWGNCVSPEPIRAGPVVDGGTVFVGDAFSRVFALDPSHNGSVLWSADVGGPPTQLDVASGHLLVGDQTGDLFDINESNGSVLWRTDLGAPLVQGVAVDAADALAVTSDGVLHALRLSDGGSDWAQRVGAPAGAPSIEAGSVYVADRDGRIHAFSTSGTVLWNRSVGHGVATAPAVDGPDVVVGDLTGSVTDLWASNGTVRWQWNASASGVTDPIHATPAVGPDRVFAVYDSGSVRAFDRSNGTLHWSTPGVFSGYPNLAAPAVTPTGVYAVLNGEYALEDLAPSTGRTIFLAYLGSFAFASPAVAMGTVILGEEGGCVAAFGPRGAFAEWPVTGVVENASDGAPISGALVEASGEAEPTGPNGSFTLYLLNGTYPVTTFRPGYAISTTSVVVAGPTSGVVIRLSPLFLYEVEGVVRDQDSAVGLAGVVVSLAGPNNFVRSTTTGPGGAFVLAAPNGTAVVSTSGTAGYGPVSLTVVVDGAPIVDAVLGAPPTAVPTSAAAPAWAYGALPALALLGGGWYAGTRELSRRRVEQGLPPAVLSRFAVYLVSRVLLLFAQLVFLLGLLYAVTNVLPAALAGQALCGSTASGCAGCGWDDLLCTAPTVVGGFGQELFGLFTLQWGTDSIGPFVQPTTTFLTWWLPNSVELGAVALALAVAIAYPVALVAGWRQGGAFDPAARAASLLGLLTPSFVLVLLIVAAAVPAYVHAFGELPYGLLPGPAWFAAHGGQPAWVGVGPRSYPTGIPVVDGAWHRDWAFEEVALIKCLWQATIIALVYVAVFLRHAWSAAATASREPHISAARARAVPERTLLWRYTGRRVLPFFVLTLALTFPAFLVTQALVESLFFDPGVGYLFFSDLTSIATHPLAVEQGGVLQAAVFLLLLLTLSVNLVADVVARRLDPRLGAEGR